MTERTRRGGITHGRGVKSFIEPDEIRVQYQLYHPMTVAALPKKIDYTAGFFPIQDQGTFGTCVAFGTGALFEFWQRHDKPEEARSISKRAIFSTARRNFFDSWSFVKRPGILNAPKPSDGYGGHCVVIVGFDDEKNALRIRNSWSEGWADRGYCWMPYAFEQSHSRAWPQQVSRTIFIDYEV